MQQPLQHIPIVIIAGAGPGDPDLLTIKTANWLQKADVVITDRLVSSLILQRYVRSDAEIIYAGKQNKRAASTPQSTINQLLVKLAQQRKLVVRLKGGDVSIFSNVLDELKTLTEHNIPYEIVPGITAASGAAAYAGIPLTARGHATAVRFLTFYKDDVVTDEYWKELSHTDDTLVFYMSSETLDKVVGKLVANNIDPAKWLAVVEQATTPLQHVHACSVQEYAVKFGGKAYRSPSLVIIGNVVRLHEQFKWLKNDTGNTGYFEEVQGKWIAAKTKAARA
ncbi:MAG TPA: uroporphyrinogen-III C-methyltransferase [Chitinophagaceae bacterium]|nr:uroporphyrinogen-III C-methyltransferase [Chitinophagaceae bacterium]